jgi:TonB-linked SusC/RagA family outer membrane protein
MKRKGIIFGLGYLLLLSFTFTAYGQNKTVSGTVTDASTGQTLPGVNILVKGTTQGTATDAEGKYSLNVPSLQDTLVFSYIGYEKQTIPINGRETINIKMTSSVVSGQQLVVIGYGKEEKKNITGSVTSVTTDELNKGVTVSADQALKGRIPGLRITQSSAAPGGGHNIRIRGVGSITAGNKPLYVIDGQPISNANPVSGGGAANVPATINRDPLNSINPNDIKSIEVLKDAAATAIYGSRGANGVILITTKNGGNHGVILNYSGKVGVQTIYKNKDILSAKQYMNFMNDLADARGNQKVFTKSEITDIGKGTYWPDLVTRKALTTSHNISISGGTENTNYFISGNYLKQNGIIKQTSTERYSFRLNLNTNLSDKLTYDVHLTASVNNNGNSVGGHGNTANLLGPYYLSLIYDPTIKPFKPDGSFNNSNYLTPHNPLAILGRTSKTKTNRIIGNMNLDYQIIPHLSADLKVGIDRHVGREDLFSTGASAPGNSNVASAFVTSIEGNHYLLQYTMNYKNQVNKIVDLNILAGTTYEDFTTRSVNASTQDFPTEILKTNNLGLGSRDDATVGSNKNEHKLLSYIGRATVNLFNKLSLTGTFRIDGSSRFGGNNKYGYFPSVSAAYHLEEESFVPELVNRLKIRASWGQTGNQAIGNYAYLPTYAAGQQAILNNEPVQGTGATRIPNPNLKWETTTQYDVGIDYGLFKDRISGSVDYFIKNTTDMLLNFPLPHSSGFSSILKNIGSMRNTGLEIQLNTTNVSTKNFMWKTSFNFSTVHNKVTSIGGLDRILTGGFLTVPTSIIKIGVPLNSYFTYKQIGIFQNQEEVDKSAQPNSRPGNPKLLDINNDGAIKADDDRMIVGNPWPDFTYGISSDLNYKNFGFSFRITGQKGADLLNGNLAYALHPQTTRYNRLSKLVKDRWTPQNPNAKWPSPIDPDTYAPSKVISLVIEDDSYMWLQNVRLSYDFPIKRRSSSVSKITVYLSGQNLLILTDYPGLNPDAKRNKSNNVWVDQNAYPVARTYLLGVNLKF